MPRTCPPCRTAATLNSCVPTRSGKPTTRIVGNSAARSVRSRSACSADSSNACWWNRSWLLYPVSPSSGQTRSATSSSAAARAKAKVESALASASARRTRGTAAATRAKPCRQNGSEGISGGCSAPGLPGGRSPAAGDRENESCHGEAAPCTGRDARSSPMRTFRTGGQREGHARSRSQLLAHACLSFELLELIGEVAVEGLPTATEAQHGKHGAPAGVFPGHRDRRVHRQRAEHESDDGTGVLPCSRPVELVDAGRREPHGRGREHQCGEDLADRGDGG